MKSKILAILIFLIFGPLTAQNYKFGKVSKEELLQKQHPTDPAADAAVLYRETIAEFQYTQDSGWFLVTEYFERIKIYTKEGFEYANTVIDLYKDRSEDKLRGVRGSTYYLDPDGKVKEVKLRNSGIFEENTSKYLTRTKITMPDVREGCVIEYRYTISSPFILNIDEFRFQETIPVDNVLVRFKTPEYFVFKTHQRGWIPFEIGNETRERSLIFRATTQDMSGFGSTGIPKTSTREVRFKENTYVIELKDVPAIKEEAFAGNLRNYTTALQFELGYINMPGSSIQNFATTWEDVSKSIYQRNEFGAELERNNYFEKDIDNLLRGVTAPEERMKKIFYFVLDKMTWNGFNGFYTNEGVRNAYKKGSGNVADINLMLIAMLRYANLNADPVLVSTKSHGIPLFPTLNGFNYVIASVELPQGTVLLDATNKNVEIGVLKSGVINGDGRLIRKAGSSAWISLRSTIPAVKNSMLNASIQPDLSVTGRTQNRFTGNYAFQYRTNFRNINDESQLKTLEKRLVQTELSNHSFENLDQLGQPVSLDYDFQTPHAVEEVAGKLYFSPMLFLATQKSPFTSEKREFPIDFGFPMKDRYIVNIALPEGYQVESLPENVVFNWGNNVGSYKYLISQNANNLQLSVELTINESLIAANDYSHLKKFFELLVAKEDEKVVLIKT